MSSGVTYLTAASSSTSAAERPERGRGLRDGLPRGGEVLAHDLELDAHGRPFPR